MKAYECTRCDSFGTSGDPGSQRCECDDIEDNLRARIAALKAALVEACEQWECWYRNEFTTTDTERAARGDDAITNRITELRKLAEDT